MILHVPDPEGFRIPVVLQNASHTITQSLRDGPTLVLSKRNPGVIVIDAQLAMEVAGIYSKKGMKTCMSAQSTERAIPWVIISMGLPNALHVFP